MSTRTRPSRRNFLKASALAVAAPTVISATALGNAVAAPASERLTVGFIGMGKQMRSHYGNIGGRKDCQILAVCDVYETRREASKEDIVKKYDQLERKNYGSIASYNDLHELIGRKDIDVVFIATPDHWHSIPIIEACKAEARTSTAKSR